LLPLYQGRAPGSAKAFLLHNLRHALPRNLKVLREARLVATIERLLTQEESNRDTKSSSALAVQ